MEQPQDVLPDVDADELTDAQRIDFLTSVSGAADREGIDGISGLHLHLHG